MDINKKYKTLEGILKGLGKVVVAYSGGVDSTFLLKAAVETLGSDNVVACIGVSASLARSQYVQAVECAAAIGVELSEVKVGELSDSKYLANKADRCFHCKSHLFGLLKEVAQSKGFDNVLCGSNFDDKDDYRPGNRAAEVFGVASPLMDAELTKEEIRELSRGFGLVTADVSASPCLASRVSYGLEISEERLGQIEKAEDYLRSLGFVEFRVRHHGDIARIEVAAGDIEKVTSEPIRSEVAEELKGIGFKFVAVDLSGFKSGGLNVMLSEEEKRRTVDGGQWTVKDR